MEIEYHNRKLEVGDRIVDISYSNGSGTIIKDIDGTLFVVQFDKHPTGDYRNISVWDIEKEKHDTMSNIRSFNCGIY